MKDRKLIQIARQSRIRETDFVPFVNSMFEKVWGGLFPPQILTDELSNTVSGNIITPADDPIPECMTCGACCASFVCVDLEPDNPISSEDCWDISKPGECGEFVVDRFIKRKDVDFSCTALNGKIGEDVSCRVYENRPRMCRQFEAGSDRCRAVRRAYGIEPFLTLQEMSAARGKIDALKSAVDFDIIKSAVISEESETGIMQISVQTEGRSHIVIRRFERNLETWFQSEFDGLTLAEAKRLITERTR